MRNNGVKTKKTSPQLTYDYINLMLIILIYKQLIFIYFALFTN